MVNNKTYSEQNRIDSFSQHINDFNKNKELFDKGENVFKPIANFGTSVNQDYYHIFIEISYKKYNDDLNIAAGFFRFNHSIPIILKNNEYILERLNLNYHKNITDFIPKSAIENVVNYMTGMYGENFDNIFINNRNFAKSDKTIKKYNL